MSNSSILPNYKAVFYELNPKTGYYTKTAQQPDKTPVMRLPYELKVEPTQLHQIKTNAKQIIRGKEKTKSGAFKFFTGLQGTEFNQWQSGDDYEMRAGQKQKSICLFHFIDNNARLVVYYFRWYYIDNHLAREAKITSIIPALISKKLQ